MSKNSKLTGALAALIVIAFAISPATAQISATGTVTAVPSGDNYLYTISLQNTGTTNIDTFWFSWLPDNYDFLPSVPTPTGAPANWIELSWRRDTTAAAFNSTTRPTHLSLTGRRTVRFNS